MDTLTIREKIAKSIRRLILNGNLRSETKLNERDIANYLGVSVTPVKQALTVLEAEGFI